MIVGRFKIMSTGTGKIISTGTGKSTKRLLKQTAYNCSK